MSPIHLQILFSCGVLLFYFVGGKVMYTMWWLIPLCLSPIDALCSNAGHLAFVAIRVDMWMDLR